MDKKRKIPRSKRQKYTNNQNRVIPKKNPPKGQMVQQNQTNISRYQKHIKDTGTYHTIAKESSYDAM